LAKDGIYLNAILQTDQFEKQTLANILNYVYYWFELIFLLPLILACAKLKYQFEMLNDFLRYMIIDC
jgi:hypothetical protein